MIARHRPILFATAWLPLVLVALQPGLAQPQTSPANWDNIKQFAPGAGVRVELRDHETVRGQFASVTGDSLVIDSKKRQQTLAQQTVARVWSKRRGHRGRNALIGLGIGAGAGFGVGAAASTCKNFCIGGKRLPEEVFTPLGAIVGALIGALIPSGGWQEVYRAP
ncbi:MAG TPA: hypothetical protein VIN93_12190 [Bryobacteraceae bacterium]